MGLVLFVCYGNVCRSPFAEKLFNKLASERKANWRAISAGISPTVGVPINAIKAARTFNVDLVNHIPKRVDEKMLEEADYIFAMDEYILRSLIVSYPEYAEKTYLITEFVGEHGSVPDPYMTNIKTYIRVYKLIEGLVKAILDKISS